MDELLKNYWPQVCAAIGYTVWLVRLEGKVKHIEKVQETEGARMVASMEKMSTALDKMSDTQNEMRTTLAGVVGYEKGAQEARTKRTDD